MKRFLLLLAIAITTVSYSGDKYDKKEDNLEYFFGKEFSNIKDSKYTLRGLEYDISIYENSASLDIEVPSYNENVYKFDQKAFDDITMEFTKKVREEMNNKKMEVIITIEVDRRGAADRIVFYKEYN